LQATAPPLSQWSKVVQHPGVEQPQASEAKLTEWQSLR
jgi:hypothetical protein